MNEWDIATCDLKKVIIKSNGKNTPVSVTLSTEHLQCVGIGTDAAVFRHNKVPSYVFKVFADDKLGKLEMEQQVYLKLQNMTSFFPSFYDAGHNYIVLSFEQGATLYDCLIEGIHIPRQVIQDVDSARSFVNQIGLNPRDIHLKNIIMHKGRAKVIDISEYLKPGNDRRWEYLKQAYEDYYHLIEGKKIPIWILETIRNWYYQMNKSSFNYGEFGKRTMRLIKMSTRL